MSIDSLARNNGGNCEAISTHEFYEELTRVDFSTEGPRLKLFSVDLETDTFVDLLSTSTVLIPVASSDGVISHVREDPEAALSDNSRSSRYFSLHTDGKYLPKVPEMVVLHCVHPGTSEIPTAFIDTKDVIDKLQDAQLIDRAREYELVFRNKEGRDFVRPLLENNPNTDELVMNIAIASPQCHLRPKQGSNETQEDADEFYELLGEIVEQDIAPFSHDWRSNDAVVFDNLRLIHGRGLPEHKHLNLSDVQRHLHRIWFNRK